MKRRALLDAIRREYDDDFEFCALLALFSGKGRLDLVAGAKEFRYVDERGTDELILKILVNLSDVSDWMLLYRASRKRIAAFMRSFEPVKVLMREWERGVGIGRMETLLGRQRTANLLQSTRLRQNGCVENTSRGAYAFYLKRGVKREREMKRSGNIYTDFAENEIDDLEKVPTLDLLRKLTPARGTQFDSVRLKEPQHVYTVQFSSNSEEDALMSVTDFLGLYLEPFDSEGEALRIARQLVTGNRKRTDDYTRIFRRANFATLDESSEANRGQIERLTGIVAGLILDDWQLKARSGTSLHRAIEIFLDNPTAPTGSYNVDSVFQSKEFGFFLDFMADREQDFLVLRSELRLFTRIGRRLLAGTADLVFQTAKMRERGNEVGILDWKRAKQVSSFNPSGLVFGKGVLKNVKDSKFTKYALQAALYAVMLEQSGANVVVTQLWLVVLHPSKRKGYILIDVFDEFRKNQVGDLKEYARAMLDSSTDVELKQSFFS